MPSYDILKLDLDLDDAGQRVQRRTYPGVAVRLELLELLANPCRLEPTAPPIR